MVTNDPAIAREFLSQLDGEAVFKRVGTAPTDTQTVTSRVDANTMERLSSIAQSPTMFQRYIQAKMDIRVTWLDGRLWPVSIDSQAGISPVDSRLDVSVAFAPCNLPIDVEQLLLRLLEEFRLDYAAIDLRLGLDGEYYFLELNPGGQFLYIELKTGLPLSDAMASMLAGH
jgi:glutathione synthase/RimK-type ligase-like ATP-grasp enzyme